MPFGGNTMRGRDIFRPKIWTRMNIDDIRPAAKRSTILPTRNYDLYQRRCSNSICWIMRSSAYIPYWRVIPPGLLQRILFSPAQEKKICKLIARPSLPGAKKINFPFIWSRSDSALDVMYGCSSMHRIRRRGAGDYFSPCSPNREVPMHFIKTQILIGHFRTKMPIPERVSEI